MKTLANTRTCQWNNGYQLAFVQGNRMNGGPGAVTFNVNPGNVYEMAVNLKAPTSPGNYTGFWQMWIGIANRGLRSCRA